MLRSSKRRSKKQRNLHNNVTVTQRSQGIYEIIIQQVQLEEKVFETKVPRWLENAILTLVFANAVNTSYKLFLLLQKHYIVKLSKIYLLLTMLLLYFKILSRGRWPTTSSILLSRVSPGSAHACMYPNIH